jgi:hypothetical protein
MMIAEHGIDAIKTCHSENGIKIASTNIELDYAFDSIKCANERMVENEKVIDRISDILEDHQSKLRHAKQRSRDLAKKYAEISILRRRISKVEEFNTEFAECFETPSQLRGIIAQTSDQTEDCDRTLTYMTRYGCGGGCGCIDSYGALSRANGDKEDELEAFKNVEKYFAKYENEDNEDNDNKEEKEPECEDMELTGNIECIVNEEVVGDGINEDNEDDDNEFEKL